MTLKENEKRIIRQKVKRERRQSTIQSALWARKFSNEELLEQGFNLINFAHQGFDTKRPEIC